MPREHEDTEDNKYVEHPYDWISQRLASIHKLQMYHVFIFPESIQAIASSYF